MVNVGVDLHKTQFTVCVRHNEQDQRFEKYPTTEAGYQAFLLEAADWQAAGEKVRVGVESMGNTRYFKGRLEDAGIAVTVINPQKFKVVAESVNKTDKRDAATIAEFLAKDMLPQAQLCSRESEQLRRLLKVRTSLIRTQVVIKNQIHALLSAEGMGKVAQGALQSKRGRQQTLDTLNQRENELVAQPLFETINQLAETIKGIEGQIQLLVEKDRMIELLLTIPGCGKILAWTIRAYTDDIGRFASAKKYASYAGLAPWVRNSNETVCHGRITKRGPKELRTALVQVVMGLRRMKAKTLSWRLMQRYEAMRKHKIPGKAIIAAARKIAVFIWQMLTEDTAFDLEKMLDRKLAKKAQSMSQTAAEQLAEEALPVLPKKPVANALKNVNKQQNLALPEKREKKSVKSCLVVDFL